MQGQNQAQNGQVNTMQGDLGGGIVTGIGIVIGIGLVILTIYGVEYALERR
jgi:hypothetical protein